VASLADPGQPLPRCHRRTVANCPHYIYPDVIDISNGSRDAARVSAIPAFQAALGTAVKRRREELGLTQEAMSLRAELHQRWISNVENGKRNPSYGSLRRLAAGLNLSASELLARAEQIEAGQLHANATSR
jgi:DNA-binding XRE family transcriptional regulator